jgi:hypothetical protein
MIKELIEPNRVMNRIAGLTGSSVGFELFFFLLFSYLIPFLSLNLIYIYIYIYIYI